MRWENEQTEDDMKEGLEDITGHITFGPDKSFKESLKPNQKALNNSFDLKQIYKLNASLEFD